MWLEEEAASESQHSGKDKITGKTLNMSKAWSCFIYHYPEFTDIEVAGYSDRVLIRDHSKFFLILKSSMIKWEDYICRQYALGPYSPGYLDTRQKTQ